MAPSIYSGFSHFTALLDIYDVLVSKRIFKFKLNTFYEEDVGERSLSDGFYNVEAL